MRESLRIDSPFMGAGMPKAYSRDLRERVITAVETGASRREAAERFEVSVASAVKWLQRWYQQRSAAPKPRGGSVSPLEEFAVEILDLIAQRPDLTLVETVAELRKRRPCSGRVRRSRQPQLALAFSRPTQHHAQKKCCKQPNGSEQMWRERAAAGYESKVCLILPGWCLSTRPPSARTW